ncbi:hypothetical protein A4A49_19961 [Nicotiana attenuata]|uniref:Uncharacterized protein n=1 Tax=Nicotiana attenuata TaxID=49451 RepID=A0A1J6IPX0_NICAT|nr:hypothetical protein A4A49_19961 [Nicotiana attenuata]
MNDVTNKVRRSNPNTVGNASPNNKRIQNVAKENSPNPRSSRIEETNKKKFTIEWVHRRFGTSKEELKELNFTVNHSCQDIPSQSIDDSEKNVATNEIYSSRSLCSDELELMENKTDGNNVGKHTQKGEEENQTNTLIQAAMVNPSGLQTRAKDDMSHTMNSGEQGSLKDAQIHAEQGPGTAQHQQSSNQMQANGIVNPSLPVRVNCVVGNEDRAAGDVVKVQINPTMEAVTVFKSHGDEQVAFKTVVEPRCDNPGILAGKTFTVTSGILAKNILINQKGQRELGVIAKNHEPKPLALQVVDVEQVEQEQLVKAIDEGSTTATLKHIAQGGDLSP